MPTSNLIAYSNSSSLSCSMASLASGSARESAVYSNSTNAMLDAQVSVTFTVASGSPSTSGSCVNIYVNGSVDGTLFPIIQLASGGTYQTGTGDTSVGALASPSNCRLIGSFGLQSTTSSGERTFRTEPFSVSSGFGGALPESFSIIVENQVGVSMSSSTATTAQLVEVVGIYTTSGN